MTSARSYLYVPADRPRLLEGADRRGADAVVLDLEDAVAPSAKTAARDAARAWLAARDDRPRPQPWVRVNAGALLADDVAAVVQPGLAGVWLPKATAAELARLDGLLAEREHAGGLAHGAVRVVGLIETADALVDLPRVAAAARLAALALGEADMIAALRLEPDPDRELLQPLRLSVVVASAAAGIGPPIGSTSTDFRDLDALRRTTRLQRRLGFRGRTAIHPAQVPVINDVHTPSREEVDAARALVDRFDDAVTSGAGVLVDEDGQMVDEAVVRRARETLASLPDDGG